MSIVRIFAIAMVLIFGGGSGHARSLNIVVVGASNTAGWGVGAANAFPARLQTILKERGMAKFVKMLGGCALAIPEVRRRTLKAIADWVTSYRNAIGFNNEFGMCGPGDCPYAATGVCRSQSRAVKKSKAPDPRQPGTATDSNRSYPVAR